MTKETLLTELNQSLRTAEKEGDAFRFGQLLEAKRELI